MATNYTCPEPKHITKTIDGEEVRQCLTCEDCPLSSDGKNCLGLALQTACKVCGDPVELTYIADGDGMTVQQHDTCFVHGFGLTQ